MEEQSFRVGFGIDAHRFLKQGSKKKDKKDLVLGGVKIANHRALKAHSDGDVVLHSLCDALLGALALDELSDIGDLFPDSDSQNKDRDSKEFVLEVMKLLKREQYNLGNVDITVVAQSPKLKKYKPLMKKAIASLLQAELSQVNIKATTTEKMDDIGKNKGIYCYCVVLIYLS